MRKFAQAVLAVEPDATEGPMTILEATRTVLGAFIEAGVLALISIAILLWLVLGRLSDMLLTLIPLATAGVVTMEICALIGMAAQLRQHHRVSAAARRRRRLQDLLHHGVAERRHASVADEPDAGGDLQRHDDGGRVRQPDVLLASGNGEHGPAAGALSLLTTLCAAVLFQPILMGKPRQAAETQ